MKNWYTYWYSMPPGTKDMNIECSVPEVRDAVLVALTVVVKTLDLDGEMTLVARRMMDILSEKE
ncbi:hypothetical protein [Verrucomicrobium spinosum]|uniref:hypothetical protein n=1 Tax=Verrucomicrobium spinosum TaxID=2736 RepID=UPI000A9F9745|nr:hypothetical protein [Verrucomicrobium spinosum]